MYTIKELMEEYKAEGWQHISRIEKQGLSKTILNYRRKYVSEED